MDTYATNTTEFQTDLWYYQKYFSIGRIGWGLYPTHLWNNSENGKYGPAAATAASKAFVDSRIDAFEAYGSSTIAIWVLNPDTAESPSLAVMEERWAPWLPRLKQFISGVRLRSDDDEAAPAAAAATRPAEGESHRAPWPELHGLARCLD
jgi:hypothetical protein